ncbi:MAG: NUDIX domain-containing protein [Pseudomonadota bacterium]|nr:NUDIX domain-containing protein [Pseudomonadota bacterium]
MNNFLKPMDAAACLISIDKKKLVLQLRDQIETIFFPGRWGFFGGAMESGEVPLDTIVRELHEELSLMIPRKRFKSSGVITLKLNQLELERHFFLLDISHKEATQIVLTEGQEWRAFSLDQVSKLRLTPYDEYYFAVWRQKEMYDHYDAELRGD